MGMFELATINFGFLAVITVVAGVSKMLPALSRAFRSHKEVIWIALGD